MLQYIDRQKLFSLHLYISEQYKHGTSISIQSLLNLKNIEPQIALCLKVLQSYSIRPLIITSSNCDVWWNVVVCSCDDYNVGSVYGLSRRDTIKVCERISKYIIWFLLHLDKELLRHNNLNTIISLFSRKIYSYKQVVNTFKRTKDSNSLFYISPDEWYILLSSSRGTPYMNVSSEISRKFHSSKSNKVNVKELVYS